MPSQHCSGPKCPLTPSYQFVLTHQARDAFLATAHSLLPKYCGDAWAAVATFMLSVKALDLLYQFGVGLGSQRRLISRPQIICTSPEKTDTEIWLINRVSGLIRTLDFVQDRNLAYSVKIKSRKKAGAPPRGWNICPYTGSAR